MTYYSVLMAIAFFYMFSSFPSPLPWSHCDPSWATAKCFSAGANNTGIDFQNFTSSAEEFFR